MIYKIQSVAGRGWLKDWWEGPIITGNELEAMQFATWEEAAAMAARIPRDRVPMRVVEREAHERYQHGRS